MRSAGNENLERTYRCRNRGSAGRFSKHGRIPLSIRARRTEKNISTAMNEELENELKKLRPVRPSAELISRVERALADAGEMGAKIIRPERFRVNWLGLGLGLAAAATFLILARVDFRPTEKTKQTNVSPTPPLQQKAAALQNYQAPGQTQVVYG